MCTILLCLPTHMHTQKNTVRLGVLRRFSSFYAGLWANGWSGYRHTLTGFGFGGWGWRCCLKGEGTLPHNGASSSDHRRVKVRLINNSIHPTSQMHTHTHPAFVHMQTCDCMCEKRSRIRPLSNSQGTAHLTMLLKDKSVALSNK